jgi:hypothetical protein
MELDHVFLCVKPGAPEAEALLEFGLTEGTPNRHPGQGTACRRFFFHNAYLELLWLDDPGEAQSETTRPTGLYERLASTGVSISPFGVCFRPSSLGEREAPFPSWSYTPEYFPRDMSIQIGEGPLREPMWFFAPFGARPELAPPERRQPMTHKAGFRNFASLRLTIPGRDGLSVPACCAAADDGVEIVGGEEHLMEIGFDHAGQGRWRDFRPALPLLFHW